MLIFACKRIKICVGVGRTFCFSTFCFNYRFNFFFISFSRWPSIWDLASNRQFIDTFWLQFQVSIEAERRIPNWWLQLWSTNMMFQCNIPTKAVSNDHESLLMNHPLHSDGRQFESLIFIVPYTAHDRTAKLCNTQLDHVTCN